MGWIKFRVIPSSVSLLLYYHASRAIVSNGMFFFSVYVVEAVLKICGFGPSTYFSSGWNMLVLNIGSCCLYEWYQDLSLDSCITSLRNIFFIIGLITWDYSSLLMISCQCNGFIALPDSCTREHLLIIRSRNGQPLPPAPECQNRPSSNLVGGSPMSCFWVG